MNIDRRADIAAQLRQRAQERLQGLGPRHAALSQADRSMVANPQRLLHELQVHQLELELQNEQLEASRAWVEAALASYTELYDMAPVAYLTLDRNGVIVEMNLAAAALLGADRGHLLDRRLTNFVAASDRRVLLGLLSRVFFGRRAKDEREVWLDVEGSTVRTVQIETALSADGSSCRMVMINVSARSARERAQAHRAGVFEQARVPMLITGLDDTIIDVNPAFLTLVGYEEEQLVGKDARLLRLDESPHYLDEATAAALALTGTWSGAVRKRHRNGAVLNVTKNISVICGADGSAQSYVSQWTLGR